MKNKIRVCLRHMGKKEKFILFWKNGGGYTTDINNAEKFDGKEEEFDDPFVDFKECKTISFQAVFESMELRNVVLFNHSTRKKLGITGNGWKPFSSSGGHQSINDFKKYNRGRYEFMKTIFNN